MQSIRILIIASAFSAIAMGASAEEYQGVLQFHSNASRTSIRAEAVVAAHSADRYADGATADIPVAVSGLTARSQVHAEAVATARAGNIYGDAQSAMPATVSQSTLTRSTVHKQAVEVAHGIGGLAH